MGNTTFDSLVTFTRSTPASRWNGAGNIEEIASGDERYQHDPATLDTSTTTLTLETGTQTLTIAGNVTYTVGWIVRISDQSDLTRWMLGEITAIDGNDVTFKVTDNDSVNGTGTGSSWYIIHSLGLLVEEQRTNNLLHNRDLSKGVWLTTNSPVISKNETGIDGVSNSAHTITDDGATNAYITQTLSIADDSSTHTNTAFFKKNSGNEPNAFPAIQINLTGGTTTTSLRYTVDTRDGTVADMGSTGTHSITVYDAGDFWEIVTSVTNNSSGNTSLLYRPHPAATSTAGGSFEGAPTGQVVMDYPGVFLNSSIAGTPIETGSSAVTVNADDPTMTLPSELESGFVWVVHARTPSAAPPGASAQRIGRIEQSGFANSVGIDQESDGNIRAFIAKDTGSSVSLDCGVVGFGVDIRVAVRAEATRYAAVVNAGAVVSSTEAGFPTNLQNKYIGRDSSSGYWNSTIALDKMYANPGDWSDADLQEASS